MATPTWRVSNNIGIALSGGYLYAPRGSSRNATVGAAIVYHLSPGRTATVSGVAAKELSLNGHRIHLFQQTEFNVKVGGKDEGAIKMLSVQFDNVVRDNIYVPIQGSIAYNSYRGYPGYGELLAGIGVQNKYSSNDSLQTFAQLLIGTNVHGLIAKPSVGLNVGLSDRLAIYGQVASTVSLHRLGLAPKRNKFNSTSVSLGLSYRFSLPGQ